MDILYKDKKIKQLCTDLRHAKKKLNEKVAIKLMSCINYLTNAESLEDVVSYRPFHFHELQGKRKGSYAIDIDGRRSSYRLVIEPISKEHIVVDKDELGAYWFREIKVIEVVEVSKHYE